MLYIQKDNSSVLIPGRNADASAFMLIKSPTSAKIKPFIKSPIKKYGLEPDIKKATGINQPAAFRAKNYSLVDSLFFAIAINNTELERTCFAIIFRLYIYTNKSVA